ncbi:MAG: penicillin-binding transpeptidase domain-containing protein [Prosthecobacter sp.]|nr:penicillin-binding transpeptidase domain-containing protein [Prosthecobacter sp.]
MNAESPMLELLTHTAAKGAAVLAMALLLGLALRKVAAARRYAIWITAVAALALLPLAMSLLPAWRVLPQANVAMDGPVFEPEMPGESPEPILLSVGTKITVPGSAVQTQAPAPVKSRPAFSWQDAVDTLPVIWIVLSALLLLRLGWSAWRLHRLERSLKPATCAALDETSREIGLKRVPRLLIGTANAVPMVWGVWRPRLLLPAGFERWTADKLRGVLLHELAHLKRGDPLALWLAQWVKALHWFNPLAWLTIRQLRADQERACDDAVLRHGVRASDYAQHLLDLSRHTRIAPGLALCALTITRCAPVEARVKAILDPKRHREALTPRWLLGLAGFALLTTLPVAMLHAIEGAKLRGRILDRNGVVLAESTPEKVRHYPLKTLAAHVLGYTGKTAPDDSTQEGREGIEKQMNQTLQRGEDVTLTLDGRIQSLAERELANEKRNGAIVILDTTTGEVLALASWPSYDLNAFVGGISKEAWEKLIGDVNIPVFPRAFRAEYPAGSVFRWVTAAAAQANGKDQMIFQCSGTVVYAGRSFRDWQQVSHGELSLEQALVEDCNCYSYQLANAVGQERLSETAKGLGFGFPTGLPLAHESEGVLPSASPRPNGRLLGPGDLANFAIGQGVVLTTPMQQALAAVLIATAGKVHPPTLVEGVKNERLVKTPDLSKEQWELLRRAMKRTVLEGAGKLAQNPSIEIAAISGTSQWKISKDQHLATLVGFAPYDQPKIAFAIVAEGKPGEVISGEKICGPIAKRIVEEALALSADGSGEVKPVGDTAGDAWEKAEAQRSAFDAKAAAISSAIQQAKPDAKADFVLSELKIGHGEVTLQEIMEALKSADAKSDVQPEKSQNTDIRQQSDAAIRMRPADADKWKFLRSKGLLADLPAEAVVPVLSERDKQHSSGAFQFRFSAPRTAARQWLLESLRVKAGHEETFLNWPDPPKAFYLTYSALNGCQITVHYPDGGTVHVSISKKKPLILIAQ